MIDKQTFNEKHIQYQCYEIRIKGHLDERWAEWFEGLTIMLEDSGDTLLTGPVVDQAALHGLLKKVRDLGIPLVSVSPVEPGPPTTLPLRGLHRTGQVDQSDVKSYIVISYLKRRFAFNHIFRPFYPPLSGRRP